MSLKAKLVSTISAFILVLCLLVVGVLAAQQVTVNLGGTITFQAKDVQATISAGVVAGGNLSDSANKLQQIVLDADNEGADAIASWSGLAITFTDAGDDVTIKFTVTNDHPEKALIVTTNQVIPENGAVNATMTTTVTGGTGTVDNNTIAVGSSADYTVTFHITERNASASVTGFNLAINLTMAA